MSRARQVTNFDPALLAAKTATTATELSLGKATAV